MNPITEVALIGRSSSHFTRTARIFAIELGVSHVFRPVLDLMTLDPAVYANNPALKVPVLLDEQGPLFGTENICRDLARRSARDRQVVLRGDIAARVVANAEEMVLHAMGASVNLVMNALDGRASAEPPKLRCSLVNALTFLDTNLGAVQAAMPPGRVLSFCEAATFCLVTYLPFRKVMEVNGYEKLESFCRNFGERASARETEYRFDVG